jgi:cytochrome c biogenesis protein CcdA
MELLIKGTVCGFLAFVLLILFVIGLFFCWLLWIKILLGLAIIAMGGLSAHFFHKDKQQDNHDRNSYS